MFRKFLAMAVAVAALIFSGAADAAPALKITEFSPKGDLTGDLVIKAVFSKPMIPSGETGRRLDPSELPFKVVPEMNGSGKWEDELTFIYQIAPSSLIKSKKYEVRFSGALKSRDGSSLGRDAVYTFATERMRSTGVRQMSYQSAGAEVKYMLTFTDRVSAAALASALTVREAASGKRVDLDIVSSTRDTTHHEVLIPYGDGSDVIFRIDGALCPVGGDAPMGEAREERALRRQTLAVESVSPGNDGETAWIDISVSQPIDAEEAERFIEVKGARGRVAVESRWGALRLRGGLEPRTRVEITIKKGLTSLNGLRLEEDQHTTLIIPDMGPKIDFTSRGRFISPKDGPVELALSTVNVDRVNVMATRLYDSNIPFAVRGEWPYQVGSLGEAGEHRTYDVQGAAPNELTTTALDVTELTGGRKGVYEIFAWETDAWEDTRRVINITDIGVSAKVWGSGALVWASTLSGAEPVAGARVTLWSYSNQQVGSGTTDRSGLCLIERGQAWEPSMVPRLAVVEADGDTAVLSFESSIWNYGSEELTGEPYVKAPYIGVCVLPRDIFRTGERIDASLIIRKKDGRTTETFPIEVSLWSPTGALWEKKSVMLSDLGVASAAFQLTETCFTGKWIIKAAIPGDDEPICVKDLRVDDIAPPRIEVAVSPSERTVVGTRRAEAEIRARYLFGSAAAGSAYDLTATIMPLRWGHPDLEGYTFSDERSRAAAKEMTVSEGELGPDGAASVDMELELPEDGVYQVVLKAGVEEDSGRRAYKSATMTVSSYPVLCGLMLPDGAVRARESAEIAFAAASIKDGAPASPRARWTVYEKRPTMTLRKDGDRTYAESSELLAPVEGLEDVLISFKDGKARASLTLERGGRYLVEIEDADSGMRASATLAVWDASWNNDPSASLPDRAEIVLDRAVYAPGETITGHVKGCAAGASVLISLETDRVVERMTARAGSDPVSFSFRAVDELAPNAWITAQSVSPLSGANNTVSRRAFGAAPVAIDMTPIVLSVDILSADGIEPGEEREIEIITRDASGRGAPAETVLVVADDGVLGLTGYRAPDMAAMISAKRGLEIMIYDVYGYLIDVIRGKYAKLAPGGGDEDEMMLASAALRSSLSPVRAKRFDIFSSIQVVRSDMSGRATARIKIPDEWSGRARVIAVSAASRAFGKAERAFESARSVEAFVALPRSLAPGDEIGSEITLYTTLGEPTEADVELKITGPLTLADGSRSIKQRMRTTPGEPATLPLKLVAEESSGVARIELTAQSANDRSLQIVELPIRPAYPRTSESISVAVAPGEKKKLVIPGEYFDGTRSTYAAFSSVAEITAADVAAFLTNYPYGCTEQSIAGGWAELLSPALVEAALKEPASSEPSFPVKARIDSIRARQHRDGGWSLWPDGPVSDWITLFAAHYFDECARRGYEVPDAVTAQLDGYIRRLVAENDLRESKEETQRATTAKAYAAWILARRGAKPRALVEHLADRSTELTPDGRTLLAAAMASIGEKERASALLGTGSAGGSLREAAGARTSYSSGMRSAALALIARCEIDPASPDAARDANALLDALKSSPRLSTQEGAFSLIALDAYFSRHRDEGAPRLVATDAAGRELARYEGGRELAITISEDIREISVSNSGSGTAYVVIGSAGAPKSKPMPTDSGVRATVDFTRLDADGDRTIKVGDAILMNIRVVPLIPSIEDLAITVPLPSGLELEDAKYQPTRRPGGHEIYDTGMGRIETRDDRVIIFIDHIAKETLLQCKLRAVTPGKMTIPAVSAEGMYMPGIMSIGESGTMTIEAR